MRRLTGPHGPVGPFRVWGRPYVLSLATTVHGPVSSHHWHDAPGEHQPLGHPANLPLVRRMTGLFLFTAQGGF